MAMEKDSDGRWLVDGTPVVVQTTRDKDGLMYHSANIPDEKVQELIESHTFVDVQNQLGERVQLSFDMDGWSLLLKDESELQAEAMLRAKQAPEAQQTHGDVDAAAGGPSAATDVQAPAQEESRTFWTYIERVAAILATNPGMVLVLDEEQGATLDEAGNLYGFMLKEPRDASAYEFDPRAWAEDRWDCSTFEETWGALDRPTLIPLNSDPAQPLKSDSEKPETAASEAPATVTRATPPKQHVALSVSASHLPDDDEAEAFKEVNFDWTETGHMWVVPPQSLRKLDGMPIWARELLAVADQYDARYMHFEPDGTVLASLHVYH